MSDYKNRIADKTLRDLLDAMGAVLIEGPKFCGKTTLAKQQANSILRMSDSKTREQNLAMAITNIHYLLQGESPRLIDEWQVAPQFWDAVRNEVDDRDDDGQFILTGSAVPPTPKKESEEIFHSGAGRIARMKLRTMSLWESGESTGDVSLSTLFENNEEKVEGTSNIDIKELAFLTCRGGWPKATLKKSPQAALLQAKEYFKAVVSSDISRVDDVERK